ncbi:SpoIIE family protein phosphatase [Cellulomonas sp. ES6]|uniref:SpoIIE family protein phosphatase n=1 Tax=Cellulomonas sp. ES6 TaxID=3039384 RepID=UPI0024B6FF4B|nr:SpoIIE family protein phosphatase [Cellulomonas sp. ES6]WHP16747.1 SpoIIE family protein phosphatase [Cellulomonas sp. ES6]
MVVNSAPGDRAEETQEALGRAIGQAVGMPVLVAAAEPPLWPVVWVNPAFTELTGLTAADVAGPAAQLVSLAAEDAAGLRRLREAVQASRSTSALLRLRRAGGDWFWARTVVTPVLGADGEPTHWVAAFVDVTAEVDRDAAVAAQVEVVRQESEDLALIGTVSDLVMDLDDPYGLRAIAELLSSRVVAWAGFYVDDDGLHAADGVDTTRVPWGQRRQPAGAPGPFVPRRGDRSDVPDAVQRLLDGEGEGAVAIDFDVAADHPPRTASAWLAADLRARVPGGAELAHVAVLALPGRNRVLGLLVAVPREAAPGQDRVPGSALDERTRTILSLTGRRVGLAMENVRLYAREHRVAETLQRAMLPEQAEVDGLDVWSYYAPNVVYAQVGGDWYDVVQIAPDVVGVVIGDVVGHDVEAAAAMGQLRSVVRAYAFEVTEPGPVLERVDTLVGGMRIPRSAGLVLTTLTRSGGADGGCPTWSLAYSRAGHLPALLVRDREVVLLDGAGGPLIGFGHGPRSTARADLLPGDVLVFYTDGLIERRDRALLDGLAALRAVAAGATAVDAAGIGEELLARLADSPEDDVAVVVVRIPDLTDTSGHGGNVRSRRWQLPSEPASIARARHAVLRTSHAWELGDAANAELVVSELVANAVLHGWGRVTLRLHDTGEGLRIEVEDSNPTPPVATEGHPGRIGGFGMRIVERLADWGWRPSGSGKVVWARVRPSGPAGADGPAGPGT